jgi:hypothetical protein
MESYTLSIAKKQIAKSEEVGWEVIVWRVL